MVTWKGINLNSKGIIVERTPNVPKGKKNIEIIEVEGQLKEIVEDASKHGMRFIRCNNCGSYMRVSVGGGQNG